ncbi:YbdD/YjiX family protein [Malikia sp.]|uniref:YbdD/YjiX family protein n=1 Tax=Malikia sp. TaxID=2070706 RepID=UPI002621C7D6|nr:YbdD/YjiX family protein [Malikia sp.]MDD2728218.1 YbdD/YjiX family protein [Malikia sp.]
MLDLSYLIGRGRQAPLPAVAATAAAPAELDDAYARYAAQARAQNPLAQPMTPTEFERYSLGSDSNWLANIKDAAKKLVQTCRLVVGIHDYEYYLDHMRSRHPQAKPFSRDEFYRYCLEARFPSAERSGSRCPC